MAQLGARFHGMEEVVSSNLTRSTKTFQILSAPEPAKNVASGVQVDSKRDAGNKGQTTTHSRQFLANDLIPQTQFMSGCRIFPTENLTIPNKNPTWRRYSRSLLAIRRRRDRIRRRRVTESGARASDHNGSWGRHPGRHHLSRQSTAKSCRAPIHLRP